MPPSTLVDGLLTLRFTKENKYEQGYQMMRTGFEKKTHFLWPLDFDFKP